MSKVKYCSNAHTCATCEFWAGKRNVTMNPKWIECDSNEKAQCMGTGPWRAQAKVPTSTCRAYQTWRYMS